MYYGDDFMSNKINKMFDEMINDLNYLKVATTIKTKFIDINDEVK